MDQHTLEPWHTDKNDGYVVFDGTGRALLTVGSAALPAHEEIQNGGEISQHDLAVANSRRIVACVNACAGIPTRWLEENPKKIVLSMLNVLPTEKLKYKAVDSNQGIALRDHFAARVMQGMIASIDSQESLDRLRSWSSSQGMPLSEFTARDSYKQADAMISARDKEV